MDIWIPVSTEMYPCDEEIVQVTYLGYYDNIPRCDAFALRRDGMWLWSNNEEEPIVEITAWKKCCEPYFRGR